MLNFNTPIIDVKEYSEIKISEIEPILKINLRGKNRDFITKIGKELSIITPVDRNTCSSNEKLNLLWLSPDEWFLYCLLYTSPSPRDLSTSRMPSSG